ncbi:hypothetical protein BJY04DRAFT_183925 [Aspergillus karnatakaensis]|uniref:putative actin binding protein n=1 Tax=Aspergillus karnatakaensis TaxID=1810916 RepID=UPI003CCDC683
MASLNLSANGPSISKSYQSVVDSPITEPTPTYAKWAIFSVSTPLVSAFQQDASSKESVLKVQTTGEGELVDLIDEFSEGKVQFAFVKVTDGNTGLPKNVLIAWCGEGVPERTKGYFTSHLSTVSKFLHGYHVQITARSDADLTVEGIIHKVGDASGAKYTPEPERPAASAPKPPVSSKPVFTPLRTGGISAGAASGGVSATPLPVRARSNEDDAWGPDAPPVTRTNLEKVQPAYQPTRVNIQELRSGKHAEPTVSFKDTNPVQTDVVKGGYQPIGKVDIAAIRRQARETGSLKDDRPEPVKGAYEPVGKVDIAAIRARAQKADGPSPSTQERPVTSGDAPTPIIDPDFNDSTRLTSLPKPKVSNRFGGASTFTGTKPPLPVGSASSVIPAAPVGSASRTFADQGGKTPAQLWAERKARERGEDPAAAVAPNNAATPAGGDQPSGEWKSSYSGKTWAPVETTHTGKSAASSRTEINETAAAEQTIPATAASLGGVSAIHDQLSQGAPEEASTLSNPTDEKPADTARVEPPLEVEAPHLPTSQPEAPRSPTPSLPERESSPIQVAMPVARGVDVGHNESLPTENPHDEVLDARDESERPQDLRSHSPDITQAGSSVRGGVRALVQYDYEKAEDNEVDLREGEYVTDIDMVDKDWWLGLNARGERGLFPSNYVEVIEDDQDHAEPDTQPHALDASVPEPAAETAAEPTPAPAARGKPSAKALYDYEAAEDNELSFPDGAQITNIEFPDDDWWLGEYRGKTGLFPANYVQLDD